MQVNERQRVMGSLTDLFIHTHNICSTCTSILSPSNCSTIVKDSVYTIVKKQRLELAAKKKKKKILKYCCKLSRRIHIHYLFM